MRNPPRDQLGRIEVICGCMFSGKSERLLKRLAEAQSHSTPITAFKHASDDRYGQTQIVTHSGHRTKAVPVSSPARILELVGQAELIAIDEAQFFDLDLVQTCCRIREMGLTVVVAGLDRDAWGEPFGPIPGLAEIADELTRTEAVCSVCGSTADHTQRLAPVEGSKMIGGPESYEPRCAQCFEPPPAELRC